MLKPLKPKSVANAEPLLAAPARRRRKPA